MQHKWVLSERLNRDVGFKIACTDFLENIGTDEELSTHNQEKLLVQMGARTISRDIWDTISDTQPPKQLIHKRIVLPLVEGALSQKYGVIPPKTIIFFGPPGTGKTHFVKAMAGRLAWWFIEIAPSMPRGSDATRQQNILAQGADCAVTDDNYDDTVRQCWNLARKNGYILVQDTAWKGYERIPLWIMQGYTTLAAELLAQLRAARVRPTHCFLQAGVGSFAAAVAAFLVAALGDDAPKFIIVEPHAANCFYRSALAGNGKAHAVGGDLQTLMAGLACGEPSSLAWSILKDYSAAFMSCPDYMAANGMRMLAAPVRGDQPIVSGESGAAGAGALHWLMKELSTALDT